MRQKLGQHFLRNPGVAKIISDALKIEDNDTIVEVGPGHGELTQALVAVARSKSGARIIAVERDPSLAADARQRFGELPWVEIIEADILSFFATPVTHDKLASGYKLAGNIPYYLTGHLLRKISELEQQPSVTALMLQKEVAERIVASPPRMNRLAASVQAWAKPKILKIVKRSEFQPPPEVDSAVLLLEIAPKASGWSLDKASLYGTIRMIFAQPRKTVLNNLKGGLIVRGMRGPEATKSAMKVISEAGLASAVRPQDLTMDDIGKIALQVDKSA